MERIIKSEEEQLHYFAQCYEKFVLAIQAAGEVNHYFRIAETTVCIKFAGQKMVSIMIPALEHLRIPETGMIDLTLCVWDTESTDVEMVPHPVGIEDFTDRGDIWGFYSNRIKTAFHWSDFSVDLLDLQTGIGMYWVETTSRFPYWVFSSPLRTLFHWWMEKKGYQLLHAAAIGTDDGAVLITGKGGVGKSNTALTCLDNGFYYLADDYVIISPDPEPCAYSLYNTAKLNPEDIDKFPGFAKLAMNLKLESHEKVVIYLFPEYKERLRYSLPIKAVFLPEVCSQDETNIGTVPFWKIQRAMAFTTMSQLPNVGRQTTRFIDRLIHTLPTYALEIGRNQNHIADTLANYISNPDLCKHLHTTESDQSSALKPLVTVIMPVYNGERFIREAIENIISQNYPAVEIIIINDGSTDDTDGVVKAVEKEHNLALRYFWYGNDGPGFARNRGIRDASGDFITFLDVDDLWPENNLNFLVNELLQNPDADVVRGYGQLMRLNEETGQFECYGDPGESFPAYIGAAMYRKEVFRKVGLFDTSMTFGEDSDWYMRATELKVNMKWYDKVTLFVRRHGKNMTEGKSLVELNTLRVFKKAIDRMRKEKEENKKS